MQNPNSLPAHKTTSFAVLAALIMVAVSSQPAAADALYTVRQTFTVKDIPAGAKQIRGWFWMPEDRPEQKVTDFRIVEAPASVRVTRDPTYGRSWIYAEASADSQKPLKVVTEFKVQRKSVSGSADPAKTGPLSPEHRRTHALQTRLDELHMEATPAIRKIAEDLAKGEKNPVTLARKYYDFVIEKSDHYSKFGPAAKGKGLGDATECLNGAGDTCTDQHALFTALCRSQGIPTRLVFGSRLKPENAGKDHDPGYRCWPFFFAPGSGWIPVDVSSGDTAAPDKAHQFFGGLDENRVEWAEGRDFQLEPPSAVKPDLVIRGWVEIDGKRHTGLDRTINFQRQELQTAAK